MVWFLLFFLFLDYARFTKNSRGKASTRDRTIRQDCCIIYCISVAPKARRREIMFAQKQQYCSPLLVTILFALRHA